MKMDITTAIEITGYIGKYNVMAAIRALRADKGWGLKQSYHCIKHYLDKRPGEMEQEDLDEAAARFFRDAMDGLLWTDDVLWTEHGPTTHESLPKESVREISVEELFERCGQGGLPPFCYPGGVDKERFKAVVNSILDNGFSITNDTLNVIR